MNKTLENQKIKICFVSLNSYPLFTKKKLDYVGGAEVQQVKIAKELKKRGYAISFVTYGFENNKREIVDGIDILPAYDRNDKNLSFLKKIVCIWRKMKEADADVYFYRVGSPFITSIFGILKKKKNIKSIGSNTELTRELIIKNNFFKGSFGKILNWFDIKFSDVIISQNNFQKSKIKKMLKGDSIIIKNGIDVPVQIKKEEKDNSLLWVGTFKDVKQPDLLLKIAKILPKYNFIMVGGEGKNPELFNNIKNEANNISNLQIIGFVPHNEVVNYYKKAVLLINTSKVEGFPNVFLEAWINSIPIISLNVDPDGIITKFKLGYHSKQFDNMIENIKVLMENRSLREEMGNNGRKYIENYHNIKNVVNKYENVINNLLKK